MGVQGYSCVMLKFKVLHGNENDLLYQVSQMISSVNYDQLLDPQSKILQCVNFLFTTI